MRIHRPVDDPPREGLEPLARGRQVANLSGEEPSRVLEDLLPRPGELPRPQEPGRLEEIPVPKEGVRELGQPQALRGRRLQDGRRPAVPGRDLEGEVRDEGLRVPEIDLVHDVHVPDLEDPRLQDLDRVPREGHLDDDRRVGAARDLDLALPRADRLHEDEVHAHRVEDRDGLERREGETSCMSAGRHGPDEDAGIRPRLRHPDPVAEDRPTRVGGRRIDGDDAHPLPALPELADEAADEGPLPHARGAREPDDVGLPREGVEGREGLRGLGLVVLDEGNEFPRRALVPRPQALDEIPDAWEGAPGSRGHALTHPSRPSRRTRRSPRGACPDRTRP